MKFPKILGYWGKGSVMLLFLCSTCTPSAYFHYARNTPLNPPPGMVFLGPWVPLPSSGATTPLSQGFLLSLNQTLTRALPSQASILYPAHLPGPADLENPRFHLWIYGFYLYNSQEISAFSGKGVPSLSLWIFSIHAQQKPLRVSQWSLYIHGEGTITGETFSREALEERAIAEVQRLFPCATGATTC